MPIASFRAHELTLADIEGGWFGRSALFGPLRQLLHAEGLLTPRISKELDEGELYWTLERRLTADAAARRRIPPDLVEMAMARKSFDYRVMNLLLCVAGACLWLTMHLARRGTLHAGHGARCVMHGARCTGRRTAFHQIAIWFHAAVVFCRTQAHAPKPRMHTALLPSVPLLTERHTCRDSQARHAIAWRLV